MRLVEALPEFSAELESSLLAIGRDDVARQIQEVDLQRYTYDDSCNAAYIHVKSPKPLDSVQLNIVGLKHGETIVVEHRYWVNVDTDNFGRLRGIEVLIGSDVAARLSKILPP